MIKYFLFLLVIFHSHSYSQNVPEQYSRAMQAFNDGAYPQAYSLFNEFGRTYSLDDEFSSAAFYYSAESLVKMGQMEASIPAYHFFINKFQTSNFRDDALYKLATIYFDLKEYSKSREQFITLINEYPESEFAGSSLYFVGEAFVNERKLDDAIKFLEDAIFAGKNNKYVVQSIYSLANLYEKSGDFHNAVNYYDQLLTNHKSSMLAPDAQVRIGLCFFKLKEYDNAVMELSDPLIEDLPLVQKTEAKYILANSFYRLREYNEAEPVFEKLVKENPTSPLIREIRYGLAWVYFQQQKYDEAFQVFNLLSKDNDSIAVKSLFWSGECKRYDNKENEANLIYKEFLEKYPDSDLIPRVKLQMGVSDFTKSNVKASEENLLASTNSEDNFVKGKAFTILGEMKLNQKQYQQANNYLSKALEIENLHPELANRALLGLAISQYYQNQYDETIKNLTELQNRNNNFESDKIHYYLAEAYFAKNQFNNALKSYNAVGNNTELNQHVLYGKSYSYFNLKDFANASYSFSDYIKKYKKDSRIVDAKLRLADSYYGLKKYSEAGKIYREIFLSGNENVNSDYAYYQYAQALYKSGNADEAIKEFATLQEKFPSSKYITESQYIIGWIHFQKGNFSQAVSNYHILIQRYPNSPLVPITLNSIGNAYFNTAEYDSAIAYYNKVLDNYRNTKYIFESINGIKDCFIAMEKQDQAINLIDRFVAENFASEYADEVAFMKGEIYYSMENYEKAKQNYKDFISTFPRSNRISEAYYWTGKSAANLGQNEEALYNLNVVFSNYLNTEIGIASVIEMGRIHSELKNYSAAIKIYSAALGKLPPQSNKIAELMYNKAQAEISSGDFNSAYEDFSYIIQYYDETIFAANSKFELGVIELARKNYQTADLLFKELSEKRIDDIGAKAQYYYGVSLFEQNKIDESITALVRVQFVFARYDEWLTKSLLKLGECYERKNDSVKAREMYQTVLARHRSDSYGTEAQNKLRMLK